MERFLIGGILFEFYSEHALILKREDYNFLYTRPQKYIKHISIFIHYTPQLPQLPLAINYSSDELIIGQTNHIEIRGYSSNYDHITPRYAVSMLDNSKIDIYLNTAASIWNNPGFRIWSLLHMERLLLEVNSFVLHCSFLVYQNKAILFSAPSGTGKTTQAKLWEKLYGAKIVNGDKALIQKKHDCWYACGYPFHGSSDECFNEDYPINTIVIVRQSQDNYIEKLSDLKKVQAIYSETTVNSWDVSSVNKVMNYITDLIEHVDVVCQKCTVDDDACHTLYQYLEGVQNESI